MAFRFEGLRGLGVVSLITVLYGFAVRLDYIVGFPRVLFVLHIWTAQRDVGECGCRGSRASWDPALSSHIALPTVQVYMWGSGLKGLRTEGIGLGLGLGLFRI